MKRRRLDRRGSVAIEFAAAGMAFLLFLLLAFETALQLAVGAALDRGARVASRAGALGTLVGDPTAQTDAVRDLVLRAAPSLLSDSNRLDVKVENFAAFADLATPARSSLGAGDPSEVARYALAYRQPFFSDLALLRDLIGRNFIEHRAVLLVKNEPAPRS